MTFHLIPAILSPLPIMNRPYAPKTSFCLFKTMRISLRLMCGSSTADEFGMSINWTESNILIVCGTWMVVVQA
jgi:hypothetical protein